jgi:hypothetical protein
MSSSKKVDRQRDFAAVVYLSEPESRILSPLHNVFVHTEYLFTQGKGGSVEPERTLQGERSQS